MVKLDGIVSVPMTTLSLVEFFRSLMLFVLETNVTSVQKPLYDDEKSVIARGSPYLPYTSFNSRVPPFLLGYYKSCGRSLSLSLSRSRSFEPDSTPAVTQTDRMLQQSAFKLMMVEREE
jgi:hypothetical protein